MLTIPRPGPIPGVLMAWLACVAPLRADDARTEANIPVELTFESRDDHRDPFGGVTLDCVFRTPSGRTLRVPAFWAGGKSWRVRYASGEVGTHAYQTEGPGLADAGLVGVAGRVEVVPYPGENPLFRHGPIRVADDRRHLAHADGTPFFWLGDTWWMGLCHRLRWPDDFGRLADDRRAKGYNVVQIVAGLYPDQPAFDPRGANEAGFPWEPGYATIRPAYFDAADLRLRALVDRGMTPCIVGMWGYYLNWMGPEKAKAHWRYLIARYGAWPVVWCVAGEANLPWYLAPGFPFDDREVVHGWTEVLRSVRATDPFRRPLTIHPTAINKYTARHATDDAGLLDFDLLQTPHGLRGAADVTLKAARESYSATPTMPVVDGEASYERLNDNLPTEWARAMFWICMTSGAAGHTYGANGIWQVNRPGEPYGKSPTGGNYGTIPWDEAMALPGSSQLGAARRFLELYPWHQFEPHPEWVAQDPEPTIDQALPPRWIWHPEGDPTRDAPVAPRWFRGVVSVLADRPVRRARLRVGADDRFNAWIDGRDLGAGAGWATPRDIDVTADLHPGRHVIAIRAENVPAPVTLNPAGLVAWLDIESVDGTSTRVSTDGGWRSSAVEVPGWQALDFDGSGWARVVDLGPLGMAPWGSPSSPSPFPPLAFGLTDGPRVVYSQEPRPVRLMGLEANRQYQVTRFDPVAGMTAPIPSIRADADGKATLADPGDGHDWVVALVPG